MCDSLQDMCKVVISFMFTVKQNNAVASAPRYVLLTELSSAGHQALISRQLPFETSQSMAMHNQNHHVTVKISTSNLLFSQYGNDPLNFP
jgi:hypothetical protein